MVVRPPSHRGSKVTQIININQKGATLHHSNYRTRSLLNTITKLYGALLKNRLEQKVEHRIQPKQFALRKRRSTAQPIHIARRFRDYCGRYGQLGLLLLLDWQNALEFVYQHEIWHTLRKSGVSARLQEAEQQYYLDASLHVQHEHHTSDIHPQGKGTRQ
jgi:hypothetical protein